MEFTGERYCPQIRGEIALEHYLRYVLAASLAGGKDVLDMASGEGYGSFLLAGRARSVVGVDVSREAVDNAAATYATPNLRYLAGDAAAIPLPDASVDMVVSFETIEHHDRQEEMMAEIRRVLRPGGLLMLSSPERAVNEDACGRNPYHVRELYRHELEALIRRYFPHCAFWGQRTVFAAVLAGEDAAGSAALRTWPVGARMDSDAAVQGLDAPKFHIVLASDAAALPSLPLALMEGDVRESEAFALAAAEAAGEREALERQIRDMREAHAALERDLSGMAAKCLFQERKIDQMEHSRSWKLTAPLRALGGVARRLRRRFFFLLLHLIDASRRALCRLCGRRVPPRVVLVSGEAHTAGHVYRMRRLYEALRPGHDALLLSVEEVEENPWRARRADLLWIWRARLTPGLERAVAGVRRGGGRVIFDIDDLCFHPSHYAVEYMDSIRHLNFDVDVLRRDGERIHALAARADFCVGTTPPLARELLMKTGKGAAVVRNTFDHACRLRCRAERRAFLEGKEDDILRIGYAAGTATHQADFAVAASALRRVLEKHPHVRLVLFNTVDISEMDALSGMEQAIEWRDTVPLEDLPRELARFDINIIPLETDNVFCHCKSELKFFEAALAGVPSVASPTRPFCDAIRDGENGFLAEGPREWEEKLECLVRDAALRGRMGGAALRSVLWRFGPEYLRHGAAAVVEYVLGDAARRARVFASEALCLQRDGERGGEAIAVPEYEVVFSSGPGSARVAVVIPLYNYETYVLEALESLRAQTLQDFDVVVVNDCSTDASEETAERWLREHRARFGSVALLRNSRNSGLAMSRNAGIDYAGAEFVMLLDADNLLLPRCLEECAARLDEGTQAFVFPRIEVFGDSGRDAVSRGDWNPAQLRYANYIDAMSMIKKAHWAAVGGYTVQNLGWEDYDFWCKLVERGFYGVNTRDVLARYRAHGASMLHQVTDGERSKEAIKEAMRKRHPWMEF